MCASSLVPIVVSIWPTKLNFMSRNLDDVTFGWTQNVYVEQDCVVRYCKLGEGEDKYCNARRQKRVKRTGS